jgi:hypothetical protein
MQKRPLIFIFFSIHVLCTPLPPPPPSPSGPQQIAASVTTPQAIARHHQQQQQVCTTMSLKQTWHHHATPSPLHHTHQQLDLAAGEEEVVATTVDLAVGGRRGRGRCPGSHHQGRGGREREARGVVRRQRPQGSERRRGGSEAGWRRTWMEKKIKLKGLFLYMHDQRGRMDLSGTI